MTMLLPRLARLAAPRIARLALCAVLALPVAAIVAPTSLLHAQSSATLNGTVFDPHGVALPNASIVLHQDGAKEVRRATSDAQGKYSFANLPAGRYNLQVEASGFAPSKLTEIKVTADQSVDIPVTMAMLDVYQNVTVQASEANSVAAALAPMDALLEERSAHTEITQSFIANYTSPLADYGEAVEMAPGTFTLNGNGVGLGQSKTYFRGFPDGDYDIDFDGIPFYDTNTPTHHSWAFFPSQWLGGIDFDRSPGTASTIGPTPFGGSIHLLSRELSPISNIRGGVSYGSWGTLLADVQYDSGQLGKLNFAIDVHHMDTKGYQTNNFQNRNAGAIKVQYKFSPQTVLTGFSGVIWLDANTPNFAATRCQMFGPSSANTTTTCVSSATDPTLLPYTGAGIRFLSANNTDPLDYLDNKYNYYHVPTDFEYGRLHLERSHGIVIEFTPYTYNYDNSEKYTNAVPITESTAATGVLYNGIPNSPTWYGAAVSPCSLPIYNKKKTVLAEPCGVDKYNSYRKYGETGTLTQTSKYGVLRAGMWYEWARTSRHQFPSDPLNNWADQPLSNFNEFFWTNSYQPYAEYDFHATKKLDVTIGSKFVYYTIATKQYADDGKTIGNLGTGTAIGQGNPNVFITNGGSYYKTLPSLDANYRLKNNWSVYGQVSTGSIVPPSSVFDYLQTQNTPGAPFIPIETLPKQQKSTTYQTGTVLKLKRVTFDADFYHIRFDNSYSPGTDQNDANAEIYFLQPPSITKGFEAESNVYLGYGLSAYLNATVGRATYTGSLPISCTSGAAGCTATTPQYLEAVPSGQWVQQTPSDTEAEGISYQNKGWDAGLFNKRVGTFYYDNGAYHNQATINPFSVTNTYLNYTVRGGSRFDQTKIRLSVNNLFNLHNITGDSIAGSVATLPISANSTTYTDAFNTNGQTPINGADAIGILSGRSIVLSVTFGFNPKP